MNYYQEEKTVCSGECVELPRKTILEMTQDQSCMANELLGMAMRLADFIMQTKSTREPKANPTEPQDMMSAMNDINGTLDNAICYLRSAMELLGTK